MNKPGRLIFLSGPSCMGKGSLIKALKKFRPEAIRNLRRVVLYNSRLPRPGEKNGVEFRFRPRAYIEELIAKKGLVALESRGDLHALNVKKLTKLLTKHDALLMDNPAMIQALRAHPLMPKVPTVTVMLAPVSREEILIYKSRGDIVFSMSDFVHDMMRHKLLRRTKRQKGILSQKDLAEIEVRASGAYQELRQAHQFDHVLVNHFGGDAEYWSSFYYPVGDALRSMRAFADILMGKVPTWSEKWEEGLLS